MKRTGRRDASGNGPNAYPAQGGTMKVADYVAALAFDGDQQPLTGVITAIPKKGQPILKLYDDGWRGPTQQ